MTDELQLLKEDLEKERNNIRNYMYHPSFAGHSKREKTAVYEALGKVISRIDSIKIQKINECPDFEEELERFAYSLPHSSYGHWPKGIDYKSAEARTKYGVHHAWTYEEVKKIARHFLQMKGGEECSQS